MSFAFLGLHVIRAFYKRQWTGQSGNWMSRPATGTKRRLCVAFLPWPLFFNLIWQKNWQSYLLPLHYIASICEYRIFLSAQFHSKIIFFSLAVRRGRSSWTSAPSWSWRPSPTPQMPEKISIAEIEPNGRQNKKNKRIRRMQHIPDFHRFPSVFILFHHYHSPVNRHNQKKAAGDASLSQSNAWPEVCRSSRRPWRFAAMCTGSTTTCCAFLSLGRAIDEQLGDSFQMISEGVLCFKAFCWIILIPSSIFCWEQPWYRLEKIPAKEYGGFPPESNYLFLGA